MHNFPFANSNRPRVTVLSNSAKERQHLLLLSFQNPDTYKEEGRKRAKSGNEKLSAWLSRSLSAVHKPRSNPSREACASGSRHVFPTRELLPRAQRHVRQPMVRFIYNVISQWVHLETKRIIRVGALAAHYNFNVRDRIFSKDLVN